MCKLLNERYFNGVVGSEQISVMFSSNMSLHGYKDPRRT